MTKYLGSWVNTTALDIKQMKSAWRTRNKLSRILKSTLSVYQGTTGHGNSWALPALWKWSMDPHCDQEKGLDGCYTQFLDSAFKVHWSEHGTNEELYRVLFQGCQLKLEDVSGLLSTTIATKTNRLPILHSGHLNTEGRSGVEHLSTTSTCWRRIQTWRQRKCTQQCLIKRTGSWGSMSSEFGLSWQE